MYSTLEPIPQGTDLGKQVVHDDGKQTSINSGDIELVAKENFSAQIVVDGRIRCRQYMSWQIIVLILLLGSMVILAVVGGAVFGSRKKQLKSMAFEEIPRYRNIAALSFATNSVNNTRVYFLDDERHVIEAANSADNVTWNMKDTGFVVGYGSALAAAVSRPNFPFVGHYSYIRDFILISR